LSFLRSLANNYNLGYVTTSFLELQKLCAMKDSEESPFFNIFTNLSLGPLSPAEGCKLLSSLIGSGQQVSDLCHWCGQSPYLLKRIAEKLLQDKTDLKTLDPDNDLYAEVVPYYEKIVSILPQEAFKALKTLAKDKQPDPKEVYLLRPLFKQGFLNEFEEKIECFSPSFSLFLKKSLNKKMLLGKV